jgi:hypothetical protein
MSGRYLITSIRHELNLKLKKHLTVLECMKDSVRIPYPQELNDTFLDKEKRNDAIIDIYELDQIIFKGMNNFFR